MLERRLAGASRSVWCAGIVSSAAPRPGGHQRPWASPAAIAASLIGGAQRRGNEARVAPPPLEERECAGRREVKSPSWSGGRLPPRPLRIVEAQRAQKEHES
jgi:hypothetical protein